MAQCFKLREKLLKKHKREKETLEEELEQTQKSLQNRKDEIDRRRLLFTLQHQEKKGLQRIAKQAEADRDEMKSELDHAKDKWFLI